MFGYTDSLISLDLSGFNTSKVINMQDMFVHSRSITSLDLKSFDTSNVTSMASMFDLCTSLTSLNVSSFNTSQVTDMQWMFVRTALTALNLNSFDTSNVTNMDYMFYESSDLRTIYMRKFNFSKVKKYTQMIEVYYYGPTIYVKDQAAKNFVEARLRDWGRPGTVIIG